MRHRLPIAALLVIVLAIFITASLVTAQDQPITTEQAVAPAAQATKVPPAGQPAAPLSGDTYTVRPGDNLFRIALRYGLTTKELAAANGIVNPSLIYVGQVLKIPAKAGSPTATPVTNPTKAPTSAPTAPPTAAPTAAPTTGTAAHVVAPGETLFKIAVKYKTTVAKLQELNKLPNPNIIYVGQTLTVPSGDAAPAANATSAPTTTAPTQAAAAPVTTLANPGFDFGVEAFTVGQDPAGIAAQAGQLGVTWVKVNVFWRDLEPAQGQITFAALDPVVDALKAQKLNILFTVTSSPAWARTNTDEDGPPDDFENFAKFTGALAQHYVGKVAAYQIWNEPNLRREWNSKVHPLGADQYLGLLSKAYAAIKAGDPNTKVISAGLAPTGFNDKVNAIDDRVFLQDMYSNKLADFSDAVGAHPGGWANPPDAKCCNKPEGVETHFNHPSFFFLDTLNQYREIMVRNNDGGTAIWVTKFGWGTSEDTDPPSQNNIFLTYTTLQEQATYDQRGFQLGAELGFIGPMFLSNLNGCQAGTRAENCYSSLIGPKGTPRPAFQALQSMDKSKGTTKLSAAPAVAPPTIEPAQPTAEPPTVEPATTDLP